MKCSLFYKETTLFDAKTKNSTVRYSFVAIAFNSNGEAVGMKRWSAKSALKIGECIEFQGYPFTINSSCPVSRIEEFTLKKANEYKLVSVSKFIWSHKSFDLIIAA